MKEGSGTHKSLLMERSGVVREILPVHNTAGLILERTIFTLSSPSLKSRSVNLSQGAPRSFQGRCRMPHNVNPIRYTNKIHKIIPEILNRNV